jgi:quercetin dioxygenase-like cupin family protein
MREPDGKPNERRDLFGGRGTVEVWDLLGRAHASPFSAVLWCRLEAGGRVGAHRQQADPEIVIGVEGDGRAVVNGESKPLGPHSVVHLPRGAVLEIENLSGDTPLSYLIVKATQATAILGS